MAAEYAVYKGEEYITSGTAKEIAEEMGIKVSSVRHMASGVAQRRNKGKRKIAFRIDEERGEEE